MSKIKLLLVDDHTMFLDSLKTSLDSSGEFIVIGIATDGLQAIEQAFMLKPDVILLDITMPKLDGIKAASEIKKKNPLSKIILITMHANNKAYIDLTKKMNIEGYILKTASLNELETGIREVYNGRKYYDNSVSEFIQSTNKSNDEKNNIFTLTLREREIVNLIVDGLSSKEIGKTLDISQSTVNNHKTSIFRKLDINSGTE